MTICAFLTLAPLLTHAQGEGFKFDPGGAIADALKLPTRDAESTAISVIQGILAVLGLIAVIMIIYGGFRYLTSAGNQEVITQARGIIKAATIGLALVLLAQAIMIGVVTIFTNVTT